MIAALFLTAALQAHQPADLLFSEAWACSTLARLGRETHFGTTTPQTTGEQAMWDALTRLETLANEEAERKAVAGSFDAAKREIEERDAQGMLERATGDQLGEMLVACARAFGVEDPS